MDHITEISVSGLQKKVEELEKDVGGLLDKISNTREVQAGIVQKLDNLLATMDEVKHSVHEIESAPGRRWDVLIDTALSALTGALVGYFISK
jgi:uncharacterized protein YoxC